MRRAIVGIVAGWLVIGAGCGATARRPQVARTGKPPPPMCAVDPADAVAARAPIERADPEFDVDVYDGERVTAIELVGAPTVGPALRARLALAPGALFTRRAVRDELRRLWQSGLVDDATARVAPAAGGVAVELVVHERGVVTAVDVEQRGPSIPAARLRRLRALAGLIDDPERARRVAFRLEDELRTDGHWKAEVVARRRAGADGAVRLCVGVDPGPRYEIAAIEFPGARAVPRSTLLAKLAVASGAVNAVGGAYRADLLDLSVIHLQNEYWEIGHALVQVGPPVIEVDEERARIKLVVPVTEGRRFTIDDVAVTGVEPEVAARYRALLGVKRGARFTRSAIADGIERIRQAELAVGRRGDVTPITGIDVPTGRIDVTIEVSR